MRNLKKFLALVLAMLMVVSASAMVSADFTDVADTNRYAEAINDLAVKGIVKGTSDTTFTPNREVMRKEMAIFVARAITGDTTNDWANGLVPFTDVKEYAGAIQTAYINGIINGTSATTFNPDDGITYAAALKMAVCALGYGEGLEWPWGYYNKAVALDLTYNMAIDSLDTKLNRAETAQVIFNMLYAVPADGGDCLASELFGMPTVDNTTLFVVTATPKQYYSFGQDEVYNSADDHVEGTYVGVQKLVNGLPSGKMIFVTTAELGIDEAKVEDYFNYAVELVNFDEDTHEFDQAILGDAPKTVTFDDVAVATNGKFTIDEKLYTAVNAVTGATLINEIVVYESNDIVNAALKLDIDADGNVWYPVLVDDKGNTDKSDDEYADTVVAKFFYQSSTGVNYYRVVNTGVVINETEATQLFGIVIRDSEAAEFARYDVITTPNGVKGYMDDEAYELQLFDDNNDGAYDRAFYTEIYVGMYTTSDDGEDDGLVGGKVADVTYAGKVSKPAKGAVYVFTVNEQLQTVNVKEVLTAKTGLLNNINTTTGAHVKRVFVTIDGKKYEVGQCNANYSTCGEQLGATLVDNGQPASVKDITDGKAFNYVADMGNFSDGTFVKKMDVDYYEYNGIILFMSEHTYGAKPHNYVIVEEFADFDLGEIYLNMYVNNTYVTEGAVTVIDGKVLADLSSWKFSQLLSKGELFYPGTIYCAQIVDDKYEIEVELNAANIGSHGLTSAVAADADYDAEDGGEIYFYNGYSASTTVRANMLRTKASTVFYFINHVEDDNGVIDYEATEIITFVGMPDEAYIELDADTQIWTNKLGYSGTYEGVADYVYVIDAAAIRGFFGTLDTVYALTTADEKKVENYYIKATAAEFGLDSTLYKSTDMYYKYENVAVNLDDAAKVTIYSKTKLKASTIYLIDENGVVVESETPVALSFANDNDILDVTTKLVDKAPLYGYFFKNDLYVSKLTNSGANDVWVPIITDAQSISKLIVVDLKLSTTIYTGEQVAANLNSANDFAWLGNLGGSDAQIQLFADYTADGVLVVIRNE